MVMRRSALCSVVLLWFFYSSNYPVHLVPREL